MKKFLIGAWLAFMIVGIQSSNATTTSTEDLLRYCQGEAGDNVTCQIYSQAVYDTYLATRDPKNAPSKICVKQPAPPRIQVVNEYVAWAKANPTLASQPATDTIIRFLEGVFPCDK